jgi:hypothetical protein
LKAGLRWKVIGCWFDNPLWACSKAGWAAPYRFKREVELNQIELEVSKPVPQRYLAQDKSSI